MAITYNWLVTTMAVAPQENGLDNVIKEIGWKLQGTDGTHTATAGRYGVIPFVPVNTGSFKAFDSFTQAEITAWLESNVPDVAGLRADIDAQIAQMISPSIVYKSAPWIS